MEDSLQRKVVWWRAWIWVVAAMMIVGATLYLLIYAPVLANDKLIIFIRKDVYEKVLYKMFSPERLPYQAYVQEVSANEQGEDEFTYAMMGRFMQLSTKDKTLMLKDMMGQIWYANFSNQEYEVVEGKDYRKVMVVETKVAKNNAESDAIQYYLYNVNDPNETPSYFKPGDMVKILWEDKRTLSQILKDNASDEMLPIPLSVVVSGESTTIPLYKIVAE